MHAARNHHRHAYTLLEMMCVLAIVVIVASLSIPVMQTVLDDARATAANDMVRARAADARAHAMESGRPWRLACLPNSGTFQLAPDDSPQWENQSQDATETDEVLRGQLPQDVMFATERGGILGAQQTGSAAGAWHTIAVYDYEGAGREDTLTYFGKMGQMPMAVEFRALTGSVTMKSPSEVLAMQP